MKSKIPFLILTIMFMCVTSLYAQNRSGTYRYSKKDANGSKVWGEIVIKEVKNKKSSIVKFKVSVGIYKKECVACWCNGEITGVAKWTALNLAEFDEDLKDKDIDPTLNLDPDEIKLCHLTFFFSGNSVTVREKDCAYHGAACSFEGTYEKVVLKKKVRKRK